jgi:hypothetical protein
VIYLKKICGHNSAKSDILTDFEKETLVEL